MGSYLFKWEHPAQEVYVTGTFDDWGKTQKLEKVGDHFEKVVPLSKIDENIYYKFVVDDNWTTDHTDPQETDASGNTNNVLVPEHITKDAPAGIDSGSSALPGAFPETPAAENQTFGVAPIAGTTGIGNPVSTRPGEPLPISTKSINDNVTLDKESYDKIGGSTAENQTFGVTPIAGTTGIGNPVSARPGEPLPISTKSINDNVTLDKESYDKVGGSTAPQLPDVVTPERERAAKGGMFGLDTTPGAGTIIPESGLAMGAGAGLGAAALAASGPHISSVGSEATTVGLAGKVPLEQRNDPFISSVGSTSTTAGLASQVPLEQRNDPFVSSVGSTSTTAGLASQVPLESGGVPEVVEKSQEAAHVSPEASANPEAVEEKSAVEKELQSKVPEAPSTSDNSLSGKAAGLFAGAAAGATAVAAGAAAYVTSTKTGQDVKSSLPVAAQQKVDELAKSSNGSAPTGTPIAATVPDTVQESISKAHQSPEAAANAEAVQEKSAVESELLKKTHTETSANAIATTVPETVQESISKSHVAPEAASNAEAVNEKSAVESELLKKVHPTDSAGEPAPTASAATSTTAPKPTDSGVKGAAIAGGVGATAATSAAIAAIVNKSSSTAPATTKAASPSTPVKSTSTTSNTLAAPATSQAQSDATAAKSAKSASESTPGRDTVRKFVDSRDVSPMTRGPTDTNAPTVTTGVSSAKTEAKSEAATATPKKTTTPATAAASTPVATSSSATASPSSANTGESPSADKKKNRRSGFFGRLKDKLEHRKDKH